MRRGQALDQRFEHLVRRTVTETDNLLFSALTMNPAAIHLDAEYAKGTPFGQRIVNSVFTLGLMVGLSVYDTTYGTTLGNWSWDREVPWVGLVTTNPPAIAGAFYCTLHALALGFGFLFKSGRKMAAAAA